MDSSRSVSETTLLKSQIDEHKISAYTLSEKTQSQDSQLKEKQAELLVAKEQLKNQQHHVCELQSIIMTKKATVDKMKEDLQNFEVSFTLAILVPCHTA